MSLRDAAASARPRVRSQSAPRPPSPRARARDTRQSAGAAECLLIPGIWCKAHLTSEGGFRYGASFVRQHCPTAEELARRRLILRRSAWSLVAGLVIAALTWKAITAPDGVADPTASDAHLSHGAVVVNTGLLVFREGLDAFSCWPRSPRASKAHHTAAAAGRRGRGLAFAATIATWFVVVVSATRLAATQCAGGDWLDRCYRADRGDELVLPQGLLDRLDSRESSRRRRWTDGPKRRRNVLSASACSASPRVYREGFEVVLFLQSFRLGIGERSCSRGLRGPGAGAVGVVTFLAQQGCRTSDARVHGHPARRGAARHGRREGAGDPAGRLASRRPSLGILIPKWMGLWFSMFPTWRASWPRRSQR